MYLPGNREDLLGRHTGSESQAQWPKHSPAYDRETRE